MTFDFWWTVPLRFPLKLSLFSCHVKVTNALYCGSVLNYTQLQFHLSSALEKWEKSARLEDARLYFTSISCLTAPDTAASGWPLDTHFRCEHLAVNLYLSSYTTAQFLNTVPLLYKSWFISSSPIQFYSQITLVKAKSFEWINHYPLLPLFVLRCFRHSRNVIAPDIVWIIGHYSKVVPWWTMTCCEGCVDSTKVNVAVSHRINADVSVCYHIHFTQNINGF